MSNKTRAVTKTNTKTIINMNLAIQALNEHDLNDLKRIINKLRVWDDRK